MLIQFGRASLLQKARSQPEKVKEVLKKMRTDGFMPTMEAVFRRLDEPLPLGYCNAGVVMGVGKGVTNNIVVGDRVASNGPHAEFVVVPENLVARLPDNVPDDAGAFTVVGAIGMQGIRLAKPEFGETFVVIGLGLIGQIAVQLLRATGCQVIGLDFDATKVELARAQGIEAFRSGAEEDPVRRVFAATTGLGADGVIIAASSSSNEVVAQAAKMSRKRGRIVLIGVVGLQLNRADFYEKELTFQVSCSYGPGRYDDAYEGKGFDYPPAFVRWTENRNFQAVLAAMSSGALKVEPLITRRVPLERFNEIYGDMDGGGLASLLVYDRTPLQGLLLSVTGYQGITEVASESLPAISVGGSSTDNREKRSENSIRVASTIRLTERQFTAGDGVLAIVGAGNFTKMTALPALSAAEAKIKTMVSAGGVTGTALAKKYGVPISSTDYAGVLADLEIRGVIITTRHNLHAEQAMEAIKAGKHVLVEKPLCLNIEELRAIEAVLSSQLSVTGYQGSETMSGASFSNNREPITNNRPTLTVGYNRRFSPHVEKIKALLGDSSGPISVMATMNAGAIPLNHWVHDPEVGGGRLVGEACHFVDLAIHLTGSLILEVSATQLGGAADSASILLRHANGSTSVVNYFANGNREVSKERIEVHSQGRSLLLDDFRELRGYGFRSFAKLKTRQDKGHAKQFALFVERVKSGGPPLIPWAEIANSTRATFGIPRAIVERRWVRVDEL